MGVQQDFISGANFAIWCNVSLTAAVAVACAPQIRTLFLKRFKSNRGRESSQAGLVVTHDGAGSSSETPLQEGTTFSNERRIKSTPLTITNKFLAGNGHVSIGDVRLKDNGSNFEHEMV